MSKGSKLILPFVVLSAVVAFPSCSSEEKGDTFKEREEIILDESTRTTASELRDFYVKFMTDAARFVDESDMTSKNMVVSPLSASMLLSMVANGVDEENGQKIADYLGISDVNSVNALSRQ